MARAVVNESLIVWRRRRSSTRCHKRAGAVGVRVLRRPAPRRAGALGRSDIDFEAGVISIYRGWDDGQRVQATKSDAGERAVSLAGMLRAILRAHKLSKRHGADLGFGRTATLPFVSST